jgi:transcriptional regulator with XRE-family HTH domain
VSVNPFYHEFGQRLREVRKAAGMTQHGLAEQIGLGRTSIANIERGTQAVALDQWLRLADVLEVRPMDLLPTALDAPARRRHLIGLRREESEWVRSILSAEQ